MEHNIFSTKKNVYIIFRKYILINGYLAFDTLCYNNIIYIDRIIIIYL